MTQVEKVWEEQLVSKKFFIAEKDLKQLISESEKSTCIATDEIMVNGSKVGYMVRGGSMSEGDSGWAFYAGNESEEYLQDFDDAGVYSLNQVCNYDEDIIPFLDAPEGSAFCRDDAGAFIMIEEDSDSDEEVGEVNYLSEVEMKEIEAHLDEHIGPVKNVYHEIISDFIHVDILVIEPTEERNYYTLCTMGMSAIPMNVPEELREEYDLDFAEMMISLPPDWNIRDDREENYWPIRWLKILARLPYQNNTWLGFGHSIPNGEPFAGNTLLSGIILDFQASFHDDEANITQIELSTGKVINFYSLIPVYDEEMNEKLETNAETVLEKIYEVTPTQVIDIQRKNVSGQKIIH